MSQSYSQKETATFFNGTLCISQDRCSVLIIMFLQHKSSCQTNQNHKQLCFTGLLCFCTIYLELSGHTRVQKISTFKHQLKS